jgi:glutathione S-transferase
MMKLYYYETLAPRKTCAFAKHVGADVEFVHVDLGKGAQRSEQFLAINPNGKVPALTDGALTLWEADAILCHLSDRAGSGHWPHDARQIDVIRWFSWNSQHFLRYGGALFFEHIVRPRFGLGDPDAKAVEGALAGFRTSAAVLNAHLKGRKWLVGDRLTVADFSVAVTLPYATAARLPVDEFPEIRRWHDQLNALPAWRDPFPPAEAA